MFIQHQNTVITPVFESLLWLCSNAVQLFMGVTTAFYNQSHTCTFLGLTAIFTEKPCCVNGLSVMSPSCHCVNVQNMKMTENHVGELSRNVMHSQSSYIKKQHYNTILYKRE